jgi:ABC-type lipoprotein release transport system permease subunit
MAWRNIWRNKRRTLITSASIFFAVFFAIVMRSFQLGSYEHMIKQSIEMFSGYLQVQNPDYFDDPGLDNSIAFDADLLTEIASTPGVKIAVPRIESFILASTGHQSKGILITGIDPNKEALLSNPEHFLVHYRLSSEKVKLLQQTLNLPEKQFELLKTHENSVYNNLDRLALDLGLKSREFDSYREMFEKETAVSGKYLEETDDGVLVSHKLSQFLSVNVGDTIVLIGQGYHGSSAAGLFPVRGIVKVPSPDLDNKLIYMTLSRAQELLSLTNRITTIVVNLNNTDEMFSVQDILAEKLGKDEYTVKNWQEVNPTLKQQIEGDNKSGQMFVGILYLIVFFGIFGTVLMMITERKREFGVLVAIGMRKRMLASVLIIEMFFVGLVGTLGGMLASIPLIIGFNLNPIRMTGETAKMYEDMGFDPVMPTATFDYYFTWQGVIILIMVIVACYIPLKRIRKMKVMEALRS